MEDNGKPKKSNEGYGCKKNAAKECQSDKKEQIDPNSGEFLPTEQEIEEAIKQKDLSATELLKILASSSKFQAICQALSEKLRKEGLMGASE